MTESRPIPLETSRIRVAEVDRGSRLERLPEQRLLCYSLVERNARPELEHLSILHRQSTRQYWISDAETGDVFLPQAFTTLEHCCKAAAELECTFHMAEVLKARPPETMESISELVRECWVRERVAERLG